MDVPERDTKDQDVPINPHTLKPYNAKGLKLFEERKKLPAYASRELIIETIRNSQITIIEGSTGSGKTTQIPQYLLEAGLAGDKKIVCNQPRRVAAINVAKRVSEEMQVPLGSKVGYIVRFDSKQTEQTQLLYMTDGILMRDIVEDRSISAYSIVIIDEAHERTVYTDLTLGLLKMQAEKDPNLKIVVMSATLEATKFREFFTNSAYLEIPGTLYPVDIIYLDYPTNSYVDSAVTHALQIHDNEPPGDILMFLTGEEEIESVCKRIQEGIRNRHSSKGCIVLPLYASLPPHQQSLCFKQFPGKRKIIVATNIAETSLTIDGVVYVIDPGFVKQNRYIADRGMSALLVTEISKAAAKQRTGRAGRTRPGKCYRLYTETDFNRIFPEQTIPEIQRTDLTTVVLQLLAAGIKDIVHFPYLNSPTLLDLKQAVENLFHYDCINMDGEITEIGETIVKIPVDPPLARALVASRDLGCVEEIATLVAFLAEHEQLYLRPRDGNNHAETVQRDFVLGNSDHLTLLNVFEKFALNPTKEWCAENYMNYRLLDKVSRAKTQLLGILRKRGIEASTIPRGTPDRRSTILKALLTGLFKQVCMRNPTTRKYQLVTTEKGADIFPSSWLKGQTPGWVLYGDYIFTNRDFIRTVSEIDPRWLFEVAPEYFDPMRFSDGSVRAALIKIKN